MRSVENMRELIIAVKLGDIKMVKNILSYDNDLINIITPLGTLLHIAASYGKYDIVKYLVNELGMDINLKGGALEVEPIYYSVKEGWYKITEFLIKAGSILNTKSIEKNPLFLAIYKRNRDIVKLLIRNGMNITIEYSGKRMKNMNAYSFAMERGNLEIAELIRMEMISQGVPVTCMYEEFCIYFNFTDESELGKNIALGFKELSKRYKCKLS